MPRPIVLIADDDPGVRVVARRFLQADGYDVIEAADGDAALALLDNSAPVDLLYADLAMPGMQGEEMARHARLKHPDLKILHVSGVIDRLLNERPVLWQDEAFLEKPFTASGLQEAVALLLFGSLKKRRERDDGLRHRSITNVAA
jgi:two-component system, cell cycle sensor histidine kinase and response regulator CckA